MCIKLLGSCVLTRVNLLPPSSGSGAGWTICCGSARADVYLDAWPLCINSCPDPSLLRFRRWVDHLLWEREGRSDEVYRMKGLLSVEADERKHMLQVGNRSVMYGTSKHIK